MSTLHCRMAMQGQAALTELTQPLIDKIFKEVEAEYGMKGIANCRLVSTAWLAALQQYPGTANCSSEADSLRRLRAFMPNMGKLCVSHRHNAHLSSNLVDQFKQLTSIELSASSEYQQAESEGIVMDHLSSTLRTVTIRNLYLAPESFRNKQPTFSSLHYQAPRWMPSEKLEWLSNLQQLRVSLCSFLNDARGLESQEECL